MYEVKNHLTSNNDNIVIDSLFKSPTYIKLFVTDIK